MTCDEALLLLIRLIFGPWVKLWRGLSACVRRCAKLTILTVGFLVATAGVAYAEGSEKPAVLSWIDVKDSHGISAWQYEMSMDRGGVTNPNKMVWSFLIDICWEIYRATVAMAAWLVDWALSFEWLTWVAGPVMTIGDSLQAIVDRFGATTTLLTVAAIAAVIAMARGRWALGVFELFMSLIIASLAVGIFANPVRLVAGNDGLLTGARDIGLELATGLANDGDTSGSSEEMRENVTAMILDTFLRRPHQIANFGHVLEDTKCADDYQDAIEDGPYGTDDDLRDAVGDCNDDAGETAENPNASMFMSMVILLPAGLTLVIFVALLSITLLIAGVYALFQSIKMIVALVLALLPGSGRGSLWMTLADLIASLLMVAASTVFLSAYMLFIKALFDTGTNSMQTFFIVDLMMLVGCVVFWKFRSRIKDSAERMAQMMAKRPGAGGATSLPGRTSFNPAKAYYSGRMALGAAGTAAGGAAALGRGYKTANDKATDVLVGGAKWASGKVDQTAARIKFASDAAGGQSAGAQSAAQNPAQRLERRLGAGKKPSRTGQLARVAVPLALAAATGGTSAVAQRATAQASRAALHGKLHPKALGPGPSSSGPKPPRPDGGMSPTVNSPGRPAGPRIPPRPYAFVSTSDQSTASSTSEDPTARLRARLAASRATPMPGSRAIALPAPKRPNQE